MKKIGIIGCGGRIQAVLKKIFERNDKVEVVGLYDPSPESIKRTQQLLTKKAKVYSDYDEMTKSEEIDWIMIGSWNCFHKEQIISSLKNGKNVFCEKPLATSFEDCIEIKQALLASDSICVVGFTLRFSPHYRKIKGLLDSGLVGEIISVEFNETLDFNHGGYIHSDWRRLKANAGTHLLEKCCHDIDILNWMIGRVPDRVASFGGTDFFVPKNSHLVEKIGENSDGLLAYMNELSTTGLNPFTCDKDIFDNQVVILECQGGPRAMFHTNCNSGIPERRLCIYGTEGTIRSDVISGKIEAARIGWNSTIKDYSTGVSGGHGGGDNLLAEELIRAMFFGEKPIANFEDGLKAAVTCFAIDKAAVDKAVVELQPYWELVSNMERDNDLSLVG